MSGELEFDLCPETGIGCVLIQNEAGMTKMDLMPDEADNLKQLVQAGDLDAAKSFLTSIDKAAETALAGVSLEEFQREIL